MRWHILPTAKLVVPLLFFLPAVLFGGSRQSTLTLGSSPSPSTFGQPVTLVASVAPATATGSVTFYDGVTVLGTAKLASGQAARTTIVLPSGVRSLRGYYGGDANYAPSTSAVLMQTVNVVPGGGFQAAVGHDVGGQPRAVAVGDFNGDGFADLVAVNQGGNDVDVLLGNGDGSFRAAANYGAGMAPWSVAVADFNGDGKEDIVTAYGDVRVLLGKGDGAFQTAVHIDDGNSAWFVAVADFNGDGSADLVIAQPGGNDVGVLLGNGDGTFQAPVNYAAGNYAWSVAVGDFNGDGKPDLAVANSGDDTVSVLLGNGDGTFQAAVNYSEGLQPNSIVVGDFNGDGSADLATSNPSSSSISLLLGNGDGTFQPALNYGVGVQPNFIAVGDFNGDGRADLATTDNEGGVSVYLGNGDGTFRTAVTYSTGYMPISVAVADFNGDGRADLVTANLFDDDVSVLLTLAPAPSLSIVITHAGDFAQGQSGATYTIAVSNIGYVPTMGIVTVTDSLPTGLVATNISGAGWACVLGTLTCVRGDSLAASASYPEITISVTVVVGAPGGVTNTIAVSGGGVNNAASNIASDFTTTFTSSQVAQAWSKLSPPGPLTAAGAALLMTDGTIMVQQACSSEWYRFSPDSFGDYANGAWAQAASMQQEYAPLYFSSAVLADGRLIVIGGEFNAGGPNSACTGVETNLGATYDPVGNVWAPLAAPSGWPQIGDAPNVVLPDGQFLLGSLNNVLAWLDPATLTWTSLNGTGKADVNGEEGWTLLPDGTVLTLDVHNASQTERYLPQTDTWVPAGSTVAPLAAIAADSPEIGPQVLRPDGSVFVVGATGHTAIYHVAAGTWAPGPDFPISSAGQLVGNDSPASLLPSGNVLVTALNSQSEYLFEFDGSHLNPVPAPPDGFPACEYLLSLPTGQTLCSGYGNGVYIYTPAGRPDPAWAPAIVTVPDVVQPGQTYSITGTQFNGLSQAVGYGDDYQAATNYPLVRITNTATGHVFYCRTHNHSTMAVATGSTLVSTQFDVPSSIEVGPSTLVVVANGIASSPWALTVSPGQTIQLTISASPAAGGTVSPVSGVYHYSSGTVVPIAATANSGYIFSGWTGNVASASNSSTSVVMNSPQTVVANFTPLSEITVETSPPGLPFSVDGGSAQIAPQSLTLAEGSHTIAVATTTAAGTCNGYSNSAAATIHHQFVQANVNNYTVTIAGAWPALAMASYGGQVTNANGYDICFASATNAAALNWELESYNGATGAIVAHVLVGSISSTADTTFLIYYGNASVSTFQGGSPGSAWDDSAYPYQGIWHFGSGMMLNDSSPWGNALANYGATATATSGEIGGAAAFASAYMAAPASGSLDFSGAFSFSFWENPARVGDLHPVLASRTNCNDGNWQFYDDYPGLFAFWSGSGYVQASTGTGTLLSSGVWSHIVGTYDGSNARFYVNGSLTNTVAMASIRNSNPNTFNIGTDSCGNYLQGSLDEVRIAQGAWPPTLVQTMYNNQSAPGTVVTLSGFMPLSPSIGATGVQYVFTGWSDGGAASHSIMVGASPAAYTASFAAQSSAATTTGVVGGALSVPAVTVLSSNGYFAIFGANFAPVGTSRLLASSDVVNGSLPTNLASTCVNVGSARAFPTYVSSGQINAIAPAIPSSGSAAVSVVANCGAPSAVTSPAVNVPVAPASPEFLYWVQNASGQNPVIAVDAVHGDYIGPPGLIPGLTLRSARGGDILTIYGIGFGQTASGPVPGLIPSAADSVASGDSVTIGGTTVAASYVGGTPTVAGLYQVNVTIPSGIAPGNYPIVLDVNGASTPAGGFLTIGP